MFYDKMTSNCSFEILFYVCEHFGDARSCLICVDNDIAESLINIFSYIHHNGDINHCV